MWILVASKDQLILKILLICSDAHIRNAVMLIFKTIGYDLNAIEIGIRDSTTYANQDYEIIITDDNFLTISALNILKQTIKNNSYALKILVTAFKHNRLISAASDLGIQCIIDKPFTSNVLETVLSSHIEKIEIERCINNNIQKDETCQDL